ncbi:MAG: diguanylate cyclase [Patulibacter sp.]
MSSVSPPLGPLSRRMSRRELAVNRTVWLATGGMFLFYALLMLAAITTTDLFAAHRFPYVAALPLAVSLVLLRLEPPAIGTTRNHVVVCLAYVLTAAGMIASSPTGALTIGAAFFIGPLAAVRLQSRRQIAAHITTANILLAATAIIAEFDIAGLVSVALFNLGSWALCFSCVIALETIEAQGAELEVLVRRDPLTGVGNRRLLLEVLDDDLARHGRTNGELSVIALDLDGFKNLNDDVGHAAGDALLRKVATTLTNVVEARDTVVRQGGDEFCVVLPDTTAERAERTAAAIRSALAQISTPAGDRISSGLGIASFPSDARTGEVLLQVADERLRLSKGEALRATEMPASDRRFGHA